MKRLTHYLFGYFWSESSTEWWRELPEYVQTCWNFGFLLILAYGAVNVVSALL